MTADEIQNELIGKVLCAKRQAGGSVCVKHNPGGKSAVISGAEKQTGAWRFEGNQHCTKWQKIRGGKEFCSTFEKDGWADHGEIARALKREDDLWQQYPEQPETIHLSVLWTAI
jgi:hypothetical protein